MVLITNNSLKLASIKYISKMVYSKYLKRFYKYVVSPSLTSLATQSSLASLPSNLSATEKIGVPKDIREVIRI